MADFDVSELAAHMDIGKPMTFEEMQRERSTATDQRSVPAESAERNPYVFEDKPVNHHNFAVISVLASSMRQRHEGDAPLFKIRAAFATLDELKSAPLPNERCDLFACELYKFCILPCTSEIIDLDVEQRDAMMNTCLQAYEKLRLASSDEFDERKRRMTDDIKRQEAIKERVRAGELPESAIESASVCPEPIREQAAEASGPIMPSDKPTSDLSHAVVAMVSVQEISDGGYDVPEAMRGKTITKIAGVFRTEDEAHKHSEKLRKGRSYKHIDLFVVAMYEWLECPPNVELLPHVKYSQEKLTEAIGALRDEVSPSDVMQSMMESDIEGQLV